jgi:uncharacterized protein YeaC (DUF1315 family)
MDYLQLIETMSPAIYQSLVRAVELGKWPDGNPLTSVQRANAMQAIIAWGERHLAEEERVGYLKKPQKPQAKCDAPAVAPLRWQE